MSLDVNSIIQRQLTTDQYYPEECNKKTIVIHHTAGGANPENVIHGWQFNPEKVATAFVIAGREDASKSYKEGDIYQSFSSKFWAHHLGTYEINNTTLNKQSVGIETDSWGQLIQKNGKFFCYTNQEISADQVCELRDPFRGFKFFHKYSTLQIESLRILLHYLCDKYNISKLYNEDMWDISKNALLGAGGIYTHVSYRTDKVDMFPQPELINMLQNLKYNSAL